MYSCFYSLLLHCKACFCAVCAHSGFTDSAEFAMVQHHYSYSILPCPQNQEYNLQPNVWDSGDVHWVNLRPKNIQNFIHLHLSALGRPNGKSFPWRRIYAVCAARHLPAVPPYLPVSAFPISKWAALFGFSCPALGSTVRFQTRSLWLLSEYQRPEVISGVLSYSFRCDFLPLNTKMSPKVKTSNMHCII